MKKLILLWVLLLSLSYANAQWKPAGDNLKTQWAEKVDPANVLPEYPRPAMERQAWQNLNGLWDYAIMPVKDKEPTAYQGKILVPFAVESSLSGIQKNVGKDNNLWYKRTFNIPATWKGQNILLNFGAVDWRAEIYINDIKIGSHEGGYTPFSFDITPFLKIGEQKLVVKVWDPTDDGYQARGKQIKNPHGIWYTPVTGIWQTVWLEPVAPKHIKCIKIISDIDAQTVNIATECLNTINGDLVELVVKDKGVVVSKVKTVPGQTAELYINNPKLWSPESPYLYDVEINLISNGKTTDMIKSYCAMRKISIAKDDNEMFRMQLNNKDYFHFGPLDQGWWPDGLYTAPTDEALKYDIEFTKDLGFNMIRKHVKVEPARWYTHCDKLGILVWQDMPNGDKTPLWQMHQYYDGKELKRSQQSEEAFKKEWAEIMDLTHNNPSVVVRVPFNEAWGQFKTEEITEWTKYYDPTRLVNSASGGNHFFTGDILDLHNYPGPAMFLFDAKRVNVLGEYGGIGYPIEGHLWQKDKNWGYIEFKSAEDVTNQYEKFADKLKTFIASGFSGAVYTQTTDVEGEVNGLITYDRKVLKVNKLRIREINHSVCRSLNK